MKDEKSLFLPACKTTETVECEPKKPHHFGIHQLVGGIALDFFF